MPGCSHPRGHPAELAPEPQQAVSLQCEVPVTKARESPPLPHREASKQRLGGDSDLTQRYVSNNEISVKAVLEGVMPHKYQVKLYLIKVGKLVSEFSEEAQYTIKIGLRKIKEKCCYSSNLSSVHVDNALGMMQQIFLSHFSYLVRSTHTCQEKSCPGYEEHAHLHTQRALPVRRQLT